MITLRGRELRRRGRHPRSAGRDRGARRRDRRRPVRRRARRPRRAARRGGARAALADDGVGAATPTRRGRLGRRLAKLNEGAAYDPQEDAVFYPRGRPKRVPAAKPEKTSIVRLEWYVPAERWAAAPGELIATLARRCPEALPTRYGDIEPLQQRYDPEQPDAFVELIEHRDVWTFWFSSRPSFGGHAHRPRRRHPGTSASTSTGACSTPTRGGARRSPACSRARRRAVGALYAEGWVEPGWNVSRNNRLSIAAGRKTRDTPARPRRLAGAARRAGVAGVVRRRVPRAGGGGARRRGTRCAEGLVRKPVTPAVTRHDGGVLRPPRGAAAGEAPGAAAAGRADQAAGLSRRSTSAVKPG